MSPTCRPLRLAACLGRSVGIADGHLSAADRLSPMPGGSAWKWGTAMRWVVATGLVGAVAVLAVAAWPGRNAGAEPAPPRTGGWPVSPSADTRQANEMDAELLVVKDRIREKTAIARALVRGEMSTDHAIARFRRHLAQEPKARMALEHHHPRTTDDELAIHMLINFVDREAWSGVGGAGPVLAELRAAIGGPGPQLADAGGAQ
jgi:hypothetical protein